MLKKKSKDRWSDEAFALALSHWKAGDSAEYIRKVLKAGNLGVYSRNAVLAKLHRMGHARMNERGSKASAAIQNIAPRQIARPIVVMAVRVRKGPIDDPDGIRGFEPSGGKHPKDVRRLTLLELADEEAEKRIKLCRWPVSHPKERITLYCGIVLAADSGRRFSDCYCDVHKYRKFQPSGVTTEDRERARALIR